MTAPESLTTRAALDGDRGFAYEVKRAALGPYVEQVWGWDEAVQQAFYQRVWDAGRPEIIVLDGRDVGTVHFVRRDAGYYLGEFYILPAFHGRGIGSRLLGQLLARADADGLPVALQVIKINPARRLYERHGFRVTGETDTHYLMVRAP